MTTTFQYIDPDATVTNLTVEWNMEGRYIPPAIFESEQSPIRAGSIVNRVRHDERRINLPVIVKSTSPSALQTELRSLNYKLDPTRGPGTLRVTNTDTTVREIPCYVESGLSASETLGSMQGPAWQRLPLVLYCPQPYWLDANAVQETAAYGATTATFFPFFPLRLSSSSVFGSLDVDNDGDVVAWPSWTINGPASDIYLKNLTTGETINISYTIAAGESITVETAPDATTITRNDGTNLFPYLSVTSSLWPLEQGTNSLQLELSSADTTSSIVLNYKRRWLSV